MNEFLLNDTPVKVWAKTVDPHAWRMTYRKTSYEKISKKLIFYCNV